MSTNTITTDVEEAITQMDEENVPNDEKVERLTGLTMTLAGVVDNLQERVEELEVKTEDHDGTLNSHGARMDALYNGMSDVEDELVDTSFRIQETMSNNTKRISRIEQEGTSSTTARVEESLSPMERQLIWGRSSSGFKDSKTMRRAELIAINMHDWGTRTPDGLVLNSKEVSIKKYLSQVSDEELDGDRDYYWQETYRAMEYVATHSNQKVKYIEGDGNGNRLIVNPDEEWVTEEDELISTGLVADPSELAMLENQETSK